MLWSTIEEAAKDAAGNHYDFDSFAWWGRPDDGKNWFLTYTHNRDSGLLDQSNAAEIAVTLKPFVEADKEYPDIVEEDHGHWACGWVKGYAIRVYDAAGEVTEAFRAWYGILKRLDKYPALNEEDWMDREYEATCENIKSIGEKFIEDEAEGWEYEVYGWLSDNDPYQVEARDDQGGWPDDEAVEKAIVAVREEKASLADYEKRMAGPTLLEAPVE